MGETTGMTLSSLWTDIATTVTNVITNLTSILTFLFSQPIVIVLLTLGIVGRLFMWAKNTYNL